MERISEYLCTSELVTKAKTACGITELNSKLGEDEIQALMHWIGAHAPDTDCTKGEVNFRRQGIEMMLFVTLMEFPLFYMWHELAQFN